MAEKQIYGVVLPNEVAFQARIVAAFQGKSRSSLIRGLLVDYLKRLTRQTCLRIQITKSK